MGTFDLNTFLALKGQGEGSFDALEMSFGMPSCLRRLSKDILNILPSSLLQDIQSMGSSSNRKADESVKKFFKKVMLLTSMLEFPTEDGTVKYVSDSSEYGLEVDDRLRKDKSGGFLDTIDTVLNAGGAIYRNVQVGKQTLNEAKACLNKYNDILRFSGGNAVNERASLQATDPETSLRLLDARFKVEKAAAESSVNFINETQQMLDNIEDILVARDENPNLEPEFDPDFKDLSGLGFKVAQDPPAVQGEIFRLVFQPPRSIKGQFLLSQDGLYYDSQTSGISQVLSTLASRRKVENLADLWKLEYDPNLGGRGEHITKQDLETYVGTVFDPELIDNSKEMMDYYENDRTIQSLEGQKDKMIHDLSSNIFKLEAGSYPQAVINNARQSLMSESAHFTTKINLRKKQVEVAVKVPVIYGNGPIFNKGEIPVNDFGYLQELNLPVELERQRNLVLVTDDVDSIIEPLPITFSVTSKEKDYDFNHLYIPGVGKGAIVYDSRDPIDTSGTKLSISNTVVTDGLVGLYNLLQTTVTGPKSEEFHLYNDAFEDARLSAQLVSNSPSSVFTSGVAIPRLEGIATLDPDITPSSTRSYIKLPDQKEFQDLMYSQDGFSIETWVHMPYLKDVDEGWTDTGVSSMYRLILANENTGVDIGAVSTSPELSLREDRSSSYTRGFMMGFTRDQRITNGLLPSNDPVHNQTTSSLSFFIAPTQSINSSSVGFIRRKVERHCSDADGWFSLKVDADTLGPDGQTKFENSCSGFVHVVVSVDVRNDLVKIYLDNNLMATATVPDVFGGEKFRPVNIPSLKQPNSFQWGQYGPNLDTFFTPWIIGGGYTDGIPTKGFMGSDYGGDRSGLNGHIGSFKLYKRPLSHSDVEHNFSSQSEMFKNIDMPSTCGA